METQNIPLWEKYVRMDGLLRRYAQMCRQARGHEGPDPHRGQGRVLSLLKLQPEISQRELSYLLDMRAQSLGELLFKLERSGYITRTPSEEDKRVLIIRLTPEGLTEAEKIEAAQSEVRSPFDLLDAADKEILERIIDTFIEALEAKVAPYEAEDAYRRQRGPRGRYPFPDFDTRGFLRDAHDFIGQLRDERRAAYDDMCDRRPPFHGWDDAPPPPPPAPDASKEE